MLRQALRVGDLTPRCSCRAPRRAHYGYHGSGEDSAATNGLDSGPDQDEAERQQGEAAQPVQRHDPGEQLARDVASPGGCPHQMLNRPSRGTGARSSSASGGSVHALRLSRLARPGAAIA